MPGTTTKFYPGTNGGMLFSTTLPIRTFYSTLLVRIVSLLKIGNKELTAALNPSIRVIPIILEHCDWQNHQLSDYQALPDKGKPINDTNEWNPESKGWQNVVDGVRKVVNKMQSRVQPSPTITPEEKETLAFLALQRGNFMMMLDQIDEALKDYSRAVELSPNNAIAYSNRGAVYLAKGKYSTDC